MHARPPGTSKPPRSNTGRRTLLLCHARGGLARRAGARRPRRDQACAEARPQEERRQLHCCPLAHQHQQAQQDEEERFPHGNKVRRAGARPYRGLLPSQLSGKMTGPEKSGSEGSIEREVRRQVVRVAGTMKLRLRIGAATHKVEVANACTLGSSRSTWRARSRAASGPCSA